MFSFWFPAVIISSCAVFFVLSFCLIPSVIIFSCAGYSTPSLCPVCCLWVFLMSCSWGWVSFCFVFCCLALLLLVLLVVPLPVFLLGVSILPALFSVSCYLSVRVTSLLVPSFVIFSCGGHFPLSFFLVSSVSLVVPLPVLLLGFLVWPALFLCFLLLVSEHVLPLGPLRHHLLLCLV